MVFLSESESNFLGIRVGRTDVNDLIDPIAIQQQIIDLNLDLCRIKLPGNHPDLLTQLEKLAFPYFLLNINQAYEFYSEGNLPVEKEISFHEVKTEIEKEILAQTVRQCFEGEQGTYFTNPLMQNFISRQAEMEAMVGYVLTSTTTPGHWARIVRYRNEVAGFVLYQVNAETALGELFGVIPEYRKLGLSRDIGAFVMNTFSGKKIINHIKLQNKPSIKTHLRLGFEPGQLILNVHVVSLLSVQGKSLQTTAQFGSNSEMDSLFASEIPETRQSASAKQVAVKVSAYNFNQPATIKLHKFEFDGSFVLIKKVEQNNSLQSIQYWYINK
jgi:hypothetical protein